MKRLVIRMAMISAAALAIGLVANQLHPDGLHWRLLRLTLDPAGFREAWQPVSADSAFFTLTDGSAVFVDIREREAFDLDHVPGAVSLPFAQFFRDPEPFFSRDKEILYILYCQEAYCRRDRLMAQAMRQAGFTDVRFLRNGYLKWLEFGFPVEAGDVE